MSLIPIISPFHKGLATITKVAGQSSEGGATTKTYSDQAIGPVLANKKVIIGASAQFVASMTIDGNAMTKVVNAVGSGAVSTTTAIFQYNDAGALGTTADIVLTCSQSSGFHDIGIYYAVDASADVIDTATATTTNDSGSGAIWSADIDVEDNSVAVAQMQDQLGGETKPLVWAGLDAGTVSTNGNTGGTGATAFKAIAAAATVTVTCTMQRGQSPVGFGSMCVAAWGSG